VGYIFAAINVLVSFALFQLLALHNHMETGQAYDRLGLHGDLIPGAILHAGAMLLGME